MNTKTIQIKEGKHKTIILKPGQTLKSLSKSVGLEEKKLKRILMREAYFLEIDFKINKKGVFSGDFDTKTGMIIKTGSQVIKQTTKEKYEANEPLYLFEPDTKIDDGYLNLILIPQYSKHLKFFDSQNLQALVDCCLTSIEIAINIDEDNPRSLFIRDIFGENKKALDLFKELIAAGQEKHAKILACFIAICGVFNYEDFPEISSADHEEYVYALPDGIFEKYERTRYTETHLLNREEAVDDFKAITALILGNASPKELSQFDIRLTHQRHEIDAKAKFDHEDFILDLIRKLRNEDREVRLGAIKGLVVHPDARAIPGLLVLLDDSDELVRGNAVFALGHIEEIKDESLILDKLIHMLETESSFYVLGLLPYAIENFKEPRAVDSLIKVLNSSKTYIHDCVASALGEIRDPRSIPALEKLAKEGENFSARIAAVRALGLIEHADTLAALERIRNYKHTDLSDLEDLGVMQEETDFFYKKIKSLFE